MQDIPESEARALLSAPTKCEEPPDWSPVKVQPGTVEIGAGLVDAMGRSVGLYAHLHYRNSHKTNIVKYRFTVFVRRPYGLERVYQLQVNHFPIPIRDLHQYSHEHIGLLRVTGDASWADWRYDDVIAYFCKQTNIAFDPAPPHPEQYQLKG
jgi:hypothetical protein